MQQHEYKDGNAARIACSSVWTACPRAPPLALQRWRCTQLLSSDTPALPKSHPGHRSTCLCNRKIHIQEFGASAYVTHISRDIHLVELKFCPDTNPLPSLQTAADQHAGAISRLGTRSLKNLNRSNKVTSHTILLGVAGTIYNDYTITPMVELSLTRHNAENLASQVLLAGASLWASQFRAGGGEPTPAGAWLTATRLTLISCSPLVNSLIQAGPVNLLGEAQASLLSASVLKNTNQRAQNMWPLITSPVNYTFWCPLFLAMDIAVHVKHTSQVYSRECKLWRILQYAGSCIENTDNMPSRPNAQSSKCSMA
eukprot:1161782-Pelagomonas_calceolata.AAC.22